MLNKKRPIYIFYDEKYMDTNNLLKADYIIMYFKKHDVAVNKIDYTLLKMFAEKSWHGVCYFEFDIETKSIDNKYISNTITISIRFRKLINIISMSISKSRSTLFILVFEFASVLKQIPNHKHQITNKFQVPSKKQEKKVRKIASLRSQ